MDRPSDDILMAYADGVLSGDEARAVGAYLATDPEARALVAAFRRTSALAQAAFHQPLDEPAPRHLVDLIRAGGSASSVAVSAARRVVPFPKRRIEVRWALPMAAALALAVGIGTFSFTARSPDAPSASQAIAVGPVGNGTPLHTLLERHAAGGEATLVPSRSVVALSTFADRSGRFCREVEVVDQRDGGRPVHAAVACRSQGGVWTVEGSVRIADAKPDSPGYVPSGAREQDALEGLMRMLGASTAIAPDAEQRLIANGWQK